jgi:hypothetical protein
MLNGHRVPTEPEFNLIVRETVLFLRGAQKVKRGVEWFSGALPRSDNREDGPGLLYLLAAAVGADNASCLIVDER